MAHRLNDRFHESTLRYGPDRTINRHLDKTITYSDAGLIRAFIYEKITTDHVGLARQKSIAVHLVGMRRFIRAEYKDMTTEDVIGGISELNNGRAMRFDRNGEVYDGGLLKPTTRQDYIKNLNTFIDWLNLTQRPADKQINKMRFKNAHKIDGAGDTPYKPEDLLTREERDAMIFHANTIRDKAFISVLFETAARVGELGRLVWGDLEFYDEFIQCTIWDTKPKKKKERYPTLVDSRLLVAGLRNNYKGTAEGDNFVFVEDDGQPLTYTAGVRILERAAVKVIKDAELQIEDAIKHGMSRQLAAEKFPLIKLKGKPYWRAHMWRHSSGTIMVDDGMDIPDVMEIMWANLNSREINRYVNRSRKQIRDSVLRHKGIKLSAPIMADSQPVRCRFCHTMVEPGRKYCGNCGRAKNAVIVENKESMAAATAERMAKNQEYFAEVVEEYMRWKNGEKN